MTYVAQVLAIPAMTPGTNPKNETTAAIITTDTYSVLSRIDREVRRDPMSKSKPRCNIMTPAMQRGTKLMMVGPTTKRTIVKAATAACDHFPRPPGRKVVRRGLMGVLRDYIERVC